MKPYYQTPDGQVTIYHARWEDVIAAGIVKPKDIALIHDDPPYGVNERTDRKTKRRGAMAECVDFPAVTGDNKPFDPASLLALARPAVLWGGNHYASRLPNSPSWLTWDKRDGSTSNDNADCEHAWSNLGGPARFFTHLWNGMIRASEHGVKLHGTQKPEALSDFVFDHAERRKKLKRGDLVFVPHMGSGPDIRPAMARGYRIVLCEVEELYCRTAVSARLLAAPSPVPSSELGPLFAR